MAQPEKRSIIIALAFVFVLCALSSADNGGKALVGSIEFIGARVFKAADIKKVMDTEQPNWFPFAIRPILDESVLRTDMKNIEMFYKANGFFDASASYSIVKGKKNAPVRIIIKISEGLPSIVDKITLSTGGDDQSLPSKLGGLVTLERGKRFRYELYETSKKQIQDYLIDNGYGAAAVNGKVVVNKKDRRVEAVFSINEGPLQRFGETAVSGNKDIKTKDITAEIVYKPGELYSNAKLDQSRVSIFNLSLFRSVSVTPAVSSGSVVVPVNVEVAEGNKRQVGLGIGYGPETKFRTSLQWSRYYLWGRPRTLTFGASYSAIEGNLTAKIFQPYFIDRKNNLTLTGAFDKEIATSFTLEKLSSQLQVKRNFWDNFSIFAAYNVEVDKPVELRDIVVADVLAATPGSSYFISSLSAGLNFAFVDNPAYPRHGVTYSLYFEPASSHLGSELDFFKGVTECHLYGVLIKDIIVASRLKFGSIRPYGFTTDIPIYKRFFSGGSYSVRGFGYQQIGPKDADGNPLGGDYQFEGNIELRYPIAGNLKGVVFMDTGNIYATSFSLNAYDLSYGVGTGMRYVTPIGPVGIDLAFPVIHLRPIDLSSYYFYLTIGQGF